MKCYSYKTKRFITVIGVGDNCWWFKSQLIMLARSRVHTGSVVAMFALITLVLGCLVST